MRKINKLFSNLFRFGPVLCILLASCNGMPMNLTTTDNTDLASPIKTESPPEKLIDQEVIINPIRQVVINQHPMWGISEVELTDVEVASRFEMILFARDQMEAYLSDYFEAGFEGSAYIYLPVRGTAGPEDLESILAQQTPCTPEQKQMPVWSNSPTMDPGDFCEIHDAIIKDSSLAEYPDLFPTEEWFLHKEDNTRISFDRAGDGATYYAMNPGNVFWQNYFARRALREVVLLDQSHPPVDGVTGIFLDNLNSSYYFLMRLNNGFPTKEYPIKEDYDGAVASLVNVVHQLLEGYGKPVIGNLNSMDHPATWDLFLPYLDGGLSETWVTHWEDGLPEPSRIEQDLVLAEKVLAQDKQFVGYAQGNSEGVYNQFVLGCYLLITDGRNAYYRYKNLEGRYREYYEIPDYFLELGAPLGAREKISESPLIYERFFACGKVTVNLTTYESEIFSSNCR